MSSEIGRNDPCHCGSGKKYKKCHLEKDEAADRKKRETAALNAAKVAADEPKSGDASEHARSAPEKQHGGFMNKIASKVGIFRKSTQRGMTPTKKG